ncbi:Oidioi.mRNA.OKI2018_I69.PAR.g12268.t1.cds [Oikopleura dioica]|uniref:Thioredoxin n=1 Tax=Oikopleura dioica TaxID=34765 RepID=A0ABN7S4V6_OIKDI|nr:Oidioi.mRNA.OKI2018_I69.PAR.g12247.t1.cds [Oikopleura dioica]CAG5089575.1 Oidioi.mRNA.OKI2018_I69.PAR.g12268.t1.cds [Oikopleura dioica]
MSVRQLESKDEFVALKGESQLIVVDYFATWCGPCRMIAPWLAEQAKAFDGKVIFAKVDVDELEDVAAEQKIQAMPTFEFFKGGNSVARFEGANKDKLLAKINELL